MHDKEITDKFVALRAADRTYSEIMQELNVSKPTLIAWSRKFQFDIQNFRAIQREALRRKWLQDTTAHVNVLGEQLRKAEAELARRDIAELSTVRLFALVKDLRAQIADATGRMKFTTPTREIPNDEYHDEVQDWTP